MIRRTAALVTSMMLALATLATPAGASPSEEAGFVSLINQERNSRGLSTLDVYWDLVDDARAHSNVMNDADEIFHSSNLANVTTGWSSLGENVGVGPSVSVLHSAFMNSTGHRDNILGDWDSVGVGVTHSDQGYMFVTVVFMQAANPQPNQAPEPAPTVVAPEAQNAVPALAAATPLPPAPPAPAKPAPAPVLAPEPDPEPQPVHRLIDDLLAGAEFPISLD